MKRFELAVIGALTLSLAACGGSSTSSGSTTSSSTQQQAAGGGGSTSSASSAGSGSNAVALPASWSGKNLVIPAVVGYPPYAYLQSGKIVGIDPDLAMALNGPFGRGLTQKTDSFENSLLGLQRGTYLSVFGADITADRLKTYDMVSLLEDYYQFSTKASGSDIGDNVMDLCGLSISAVTASSSIPFLSDQSKKCTDAGKKPIKTLTFADQGSAGLAVQSGRADATTASVTNLGYISKQEPGKWKITGPTYNHVYIGAATVKGSGVAEAIAAGLNKLIADGTYAKILDRYGVEKSAVSKAEVNPNPNVTG